ncbi:hypothetical protein D3C76_1058350 [compost metagenome]
MMAKKTNGKVTETIATFERILCNVMERLFCFINLKIGIYVRSTSARRAFVKLFTIRIKINKMELVSSSPVSI